MLILKNQRIFKQINILYSWIRRPKIVKTSVLPKLLHRFNTIPINIPARLFVDIDKITLKFMWKGQDTWIAKAI